MKRIYDTMVEQHLKLFRQMVFLSGPRQSGKTTVAKSHTDVYLNWDRDDDRFAIVSGQGRVADLCRLDRVREKPLVVAFDEIHKYPKWKSFLKGFFDSYEEKTRVLATGSAKMDVYRKGGDSMMGRYLPYRVHPLSVAELLDVSLPGDGIVRAPRKIDEKSWKALWEFGGFPEPYLKQNKAFSRRWNTLRRDQLFKEDVRDLSGIVQLDQFTILAELLTHRSGEQLVYASLGGEVKVDEKTVKNWVGILKYLYYGFEVRPYFRNVENAIRKTPKWFLRDWTQLADEGKRFETMLACHLLKAVEGWTDLGLGSFDLYYLRDKKKREVDFLVVRDDHPWFIVEAKKGDTHLSAELAHYQCQTGAKHAFQVVYDLPYVSRDLFSITEPSVVPARTFLSQLL